MRTPNMNQGSSQSTPLNGAQPNSQDQFHSRNMRLNSSRDQTASDKDAQRPREPSTSRSDTNSDTRRYNRARGPIDEAVHSVLDPIDPTHTAIPPELLNQITSQITANVLQQLKASQLSPTSSTHAPSHTTEQMDPMSPLDGSPPIDRDRVYTPPSPYRASEEAAQHEGHSPKRQTKYQHVRRPPSPPFSHGALSEDSDAKEGKNARPKTERVPTDGDATILEKIWGPLFDDQGKPTIRLSQFLRGIAVHLVEDYEPKHSLVITPDKMQRYYNETKLGHEIYPWQVIFDDRTSSISRMFREIEAQHHLVQDKLDDRPDIPGLTPIGFEAWMTLILKAHPDEEFERLAHTALHMPVSNPDDRKERFPKELSRRQFPKEGDIQTATRLQKIMFIHCGVKLPNRNNSVSDKDTKSTHPPTKPQDIPHPSSASLPKSSYPDNNLSHSTTRSSIPSDVERNILRPTVSETAADPPLFPPPQIERERKPYVANVGAGKNYDNIDAHIVQPADSRSNYAGPPPPTKLTRSSSLNNGRPSDPNHRPTQPIAVHQKSGQGPVPPPIDIPPPSRTRTNSTYHRDAPRRNDRNRSPSSSRTNSTQHRSDGDVTYGTGAYYPTNSADHPSSSYRPDNRYEHRGSISSDQRERDRDSRPRYNSVSAADGQRQHRDYPSEDDHYRSNVASYGGADLQYTNSQSYPPNSYKGRA